MAKDKQKPAKADKGKQKPTKNENQPAASSQAAEVSRKVAKRGAKEARKAVRRFAALAVDTTKSMLGVGERRINRHSNRTIEGRYMNDIISIAESTHLAGMAVDLSRIYVEPRFLPLPPLEQPVDEDDISDEVFHVIPNTYDMPSLIAPYNFDSFRIPDLANGNRKIAILGKNGSGRTTALMLILLWVMGEIHFSEPDDPVKQKLHEHDEELSEKERKAQEEQRKKDEQEARAQLESNMRNDGKDYKTISKELGEESADDEGEEKLPPFKKLLPIYIHCADLNITSREFGSNIDPAEPIVRALQRRVGTLTARTVPRVLYQRLEKNKTLILMDGYDDLPDSEQQRVEAWLRAFVAQYGKNFIIMTGPAIGYANLMRMDFSPLFIKPWTQTEVQTYIDRWRDAWPHITGTRRKEGEAINPAVVGHAYKRTLALSPAELTLKVWATFRSESPQYAMDKWMEYFIDHHLPDSQPYEEALPLLRMAATLQTDLGFVTRQGIYVLLAEQAAGDESAEATLSSTALEQLDTDSDGIADAVEDDNIYNSGDDDGEDDEEMARQRRLVNELVFAGMLVQYRGGRYRFRHRLVADYLASLNLTDLPQNDPATLYDLAQRPNWQEPLKMAVMHTNLDNVVKMKLMTHPDILRTDLLMLGQWLAYVTDTHPNWRGEVLNQLRAAFLHPSQFITNRERIAAVLVESRDIEGALTIFEQGLQSNVAEVRRIACIGIGAMWPYGKKLAPRLQEHAENDPDIDVQLAAIFALSVSNDEDIMEKLLTEVVIALGDRPLAKRAIAVTQSLAANPAVGMPTLYEIVTSSEFGDDENGFVRAVALRGIARVERKWARNVILQTFLNDKHDYVSTVANEEYLESLKGHPSPQLPPLPADIEWIDIWADNQGKPLPYNRKSYQTLAETLEDEEPDARYYGALALGYMGVIEVVGPLYDRLLDPDARVRAAAHRALVDLQIKMGINLPDPL